MMYTSSARSFAYKKAKSTLPTTAVSLRQNAFCLESPVGAALHFGAYAQL